MVVAEAWAASGSRGGSAGVPRWSYSAKLRTQSRDLHVRSVDHRSGLFFF